MNFSFRFNGSRRSVKSTLLFHRLITTTVRLPKPKRRDIIEAENVVSRSEAASRRESETVEKENVSDEGIDDGDDSDSGPTQNDYLVSSVSKSDLELISTIEVFICLCLKKKMSFVFDRKILRQR